MSISLLLPAGLIALTALALPGLIHLRRRSQYRPIDFAALRWLVAREVPRRQIRLDERWLLALRLLLLVLLALLLASPMLFRETDARPWVVVVPGADWHAMPPGDTTADAEWHWLAPEFPDLTQDAPAGPLAVSSLLRELDSQLAPNVPLTAVVPPQLHGLDGEWPSLSRSVLWQVVPPSPTLNEVAAEPQTAGATTVAIRYANDPDQLATTRWLDAATGAWNARSPGPTDVSHAPVPVPFRIDAADLGTPIPNDTQWLIWVSDAPLPNDLEDWVRAGGTALMIGATHALPPERSTRRWNSADGRAEVNAMPLGAGRLLVLAQPLAPDVLPELIEPTFPDILRAWLSEAKPAPGLALASSQQPRQEAVPWPPVPIPLDASLLLAIAVLWSLERWLATRATRMMP